MDAMHSDAVHFEKERGVTEIAIARGIAHVTVIFPKETVAERRLELLQQFAAANIAVFLVKLLPDGFSFALRQGVVESGTQLLATSGVTHVIHRDLCLVTIIAGAMRDLSGVMAAIYEILIQEGVRVRQTGDAHNAVHLLIAGSDGDRTDTALRRHFFIQKDAPSPGNGVISEAPQAVGTPVL